MSHCRKLVKLRFLPFLQARTSKPLAEMLWIDVSSSAEPPYDQLSPFFPHGRIPIPGMPSRTSDSVEGIWQGLKVIRGKIAPRFFAGAGQKRSGKPTGHQFGDSKRLLGLSEARRKIYVPAYEWMLAERVEPKILKTLINRAFQGVPQYLYDREDNGAIDKDQSLAHARLLVDFVNRRIDQQLKHENWG